MAKCPACHRTIPFYQSFLTGRWLKIACRCGERLRARQRDAFLLNLACGTLFLPIVFGVIQKTPQVYAGVFFSAGLLYVIGWHFVRPTKQE